MYIKEERKREKRTGARLAGDVGGGAGGAGGETRQEGGQVRLTTDLYSFT
jgi:hypothetical protein